MRSVNQNHHLYVATALADPAGANAATGSIYPYVVGDNPLEKDLYFKYKGWDGVVRSDLIPLNQITYAKVVSANDQVTPMKTVTVSLNAEALDSGAPIPGKDYVLNIEFQQFYGLSPEDTYVKTVAVHAVKNMSVSGFWDAMIAELNASFSREIGADPTSNPYLSFAKSGSDLVITEKKQDWTLGKWEVERLMFNVFPSTINIEGEEVVWGTSAPGVSNTALVGNGKRMADLEWFTFGERADIYRGMGYPNNFDFKPMVVPTQNYDAIEIHFAYQGTCEDIQKSEKDITIITPAGQNSITSDLEDALAELNVPGFES